MIELKVTINEDTMGAALISDDPEGYPLTNYALAVQGALAEKLGWNDDIVGQALYQQAKNEQPNNSYHRWEELAQQWALKQVGK